MQASDSHLLIDARRGTEVAFLELYRRYRIPVFRFAFRLTGSSAAAEDVTQECFLALLAGARFDAAANLPVRHRAQSRASALRFTAYTWRLPTTIRNVMLWLT